MLSGMCSPAGDCLLFGDESKVGCYSYKCSLENVCTEAPSIHKRKKNSGNDHILFTRAFQKSLIGHIIHFSDSLHHIVDHGTNQSFLLPWGSHGSVVDPVIGRFTV